MIKPPIPAQDRSGVLVLEYTISADLRAMLQKSTFI